MISRKKLFYVTTGGLLLCLNFSHVAIADTQQNTCPWQRYGDKERSGSIAQKIEEDFFYYKNKPDSKEAVFWWQMQIYKMTLRWRD